jgi:hypothetical protein
VEQQQHFAAHCSTGSADLPYQHWLAVRAGSQISVQHPPRSRTLRAHESQHRIRRIGPIRAQRRPLRRRPGCRAAGGLDAVDGIAAVVKNAASSVRDHGDRPVPLQQS